MPAESRRARLYRPPGLYRLAEIASDLMRDGHGEENCYKARAAFSFPPRVRGKGTLWLPMLVGGYVFLKLLILVEGFRQYGFHRLLAREPQDDLAVKVRAH